MKASAKSSGSFEPAPAGTFAASVVNLVDLGTQETGYGESRQVRIAFELLGKTKEIEVDGQKKDIPHVVGKDSTLSMNKKAFVRQVTDAALNTSILSDDEAEGVNIEEILGKNVQVTVEHKTAKSSGNVYANVKSVTPIMEGVEIKEEAMSDKVFFDFGSSTKEDFDNLPEWLREKIQKTEEFTRFTGASEEDQFTKELEQAGQEDDRPAPTPEDPQVVPEEDIPAGWSKKD